MSTSELKSRIQAHHYGRTEDNKVVLEDLGTYIVKVISGRGNL